MEGLYNKYLIYKASIVLCSFSSIGPINYIYGG